QSVSWTSHVRKSSRLLVLPHSSKDDPSKSDFYAHRAVRLRFEILGDSIFLLIDPSWVFSFDGVTPVEGRLRKVFSIKYLGPQRNLNAFSELRFWSWLLSTDGKTIKVDLGDRSLEISATPFP